MVLIKYITKITIKRSTFLYLFIGHLTNLVFSIDYEEERLLMNSKGFKNSRNIIIDTFMSLFFYYFLPILGFTPSIPNSLLANLESRG
jgi:hypothetical protein